ncbi:hypothetical protein J6590_027391 [Homalodisca vitripennis]|nr:hypothetical protein J6590_027391 [Homalodisca vitripennis]
MGLCRGEPPWAMRTLGANTQLKHVFCFEGEFAAHEFHYDEIEASEWELVVPKLKRSSAFMPGCHLAIARTEGSPRSLIMDPSERSIIKAKVLHEYYLPNQTDTLLLPSSQRLLHVIAQVIVYQVTCLPQMIKHLLRQTFSAQLTNNGCPRIDRLDDTQPVRVWSHQGHGLNELVALLSCLLLFVVSQLSEKRSDQRRRLRLL